MLIETLSHDPKLFESYMHGSIMNNAAQNGVFDFKAYNLHDWGLGNFKKIDDRPFGGGAGQLMMCEPIFSAVRDLSSRAHKKPRVIMFSPVGKPFVQADAERLGKEDYLLFVCGRFEGFDERIYTLADEVFSLGDFVLTGAELPAMTICDAVVRLLPGALGNSESLKDESFSGDGLLEYAQYTHPETFEGMSVPEVLRSGNHGAIDKWRRLNAIERTALLRPDLLENANLSASERVFAAKVIALQNDNPTKEGGLA